MGRQTITRNQDDTSVPTTRAKNSDACVVVYSIADRTSFRAAQEALIALRADNQLETSPTNSFQDDNKETNHISSQMPMPPPPPPPFAVDTTATTNQTQTSIQTQTTPSTSILSIPVVLLANKKDLGHLRQVSCYHYSASIEAKNEGNGWLSVCCFFFACQSTW